MPSGRQFHFHQIAENKIKVHNSIHLKFQPYTPFYTFLANQSLLKHLQVNQTQPRCQIALNVFLEKKTKTKHSHQNAAQNR